MGLLYTIFDYVIDWYVFIYCICFMAAVVKYKEINSTLIVITLLFCVECISAHIQEPLLALGSWEAWYGGWVILNLATLVALYEVHSLLKVNLAKIANTVAVSQIVLALIQTYRYIERSFLGGEHLDPWYYIAVNSINVSLILIVMYTLAIEKEEKRVGLYI